MRREEGAEAPRAASCSSTAQPGSAAVTAASCSRAGLGRRGHRETDGAVTVPGGPAVSSAALKLEKKPHDGYPDSIPMSNEKQMSHRLSRAVKIIKE